VSRLILPRRDLIVPSRRKQAGFIIAPYVFGAGAGASYNSVMNALAPKMLWRLEDTSGTSATDDGTDPHAGTLRGGATFASSGVSISAPSGYAGLGKGVDFSAASTDDIARTTGAGFFPLNNNTGSSNKFTIALWVAGSSGSQYLFSRVNDAAIIYNFVANKVEFFCSTLSGAGNDPRTGSQITLSSADTTTPHLIGYVYDAGTWSGYLDGAQVFSVSRTFLLPVSGSWYLASDSSTTRSPSRFWEAAADDKAWSASDFANLFAARNNP
jgi:hypothetical protein